MNDSSWNKVLPVAGLALVLAGCGGSSGSREFPAQGPEVALTTAGIDWALFEEEARRNRAETCAYWTLRFTQRLAGDGTAVVRKSSLGVLLRVHGRHGCRLGQRQQPASALL